MNVAPLAQLGNQSQCPIWFTLLAYLLAELKIIVFKVALIFYASDDSY